MRHNKGTNRLTAVKTGEAKTYQQSPQVVGSVDKPVVLPRFFFFLGRVDMRRLMFFSLGVLCLMVARRICPNNGVLPTQTRKRMR